jgi:Tol biopolymer transport system component
LEAPLRAVRPDGTAVELPQINLRPGGQRYRFLPGGEGLVYMQGQLESQDFWLLNVATGATRRLTQLGENGEVHAFDLTPDGEQIVFDRVRDSSDIVLIDLPR